MRLGSRDSVANGGIIPQGPCRWMRRSGSAGCPGRVVEIFGPESSGKTTLALHVIAEAQERAASRLTSMLSTRWTRITRASWE
jgi:recombination protein RecA